MPFSFKPEISETGTQVPSPAAAPQASFGSSSSATMMSREVEGGKSLVQLALTFIFGITVFFAVALYAYTYYLSSQIETKKATLSSYESRLATLPLEDMRKLSNRIKIINQLVKEHPSANVAFKIIEDSIENQVTYKQFELRYAEQAKSFSLLLRGVAPGYRGVAQQIDTLKRKPYTTYISNVVVEALRPDEAGKIAFTLKMPIAIAGLLPEGVNLSDGASDRIASSTSAGAQVLQQATTTDANPGASGTSTVQTTGTTTTAGASKP